MFSVQGLDELINQIAQTFNSERLFTLKEVGIIPEPLPSSEVVTCTSALHKQGEYVGLSAWILPKLYRRSISRLANDRKDIDASISLLLATPDNLTAWNVRKAMTTEDLVSAELEFSRLMLTRAPKSAESWSHRAWVLRQFQCPISPSQLETEMQLAWLAASRVQHNYYVGVHRSRLIPCLCVEIMKRELTESRKWLRVHVADCSGWWYHRALLTALASQGQAEDRVEQQWFDDMYQRYSRQYQNIETHMRLRTGRK